MDSMLRALHSGYNKTFQCQLLIHLVRDLELLKLATGTLQVTDFELDTCKVIWEAAADYYQEFRKTPDMSILQLQVMKVVQNADNKFKSYVTPEEMEALADLLGMISSTPSLNSDYFKAELPKYIKWIRTSKIVGDYSSNIKAGADPGRMMGQLTEVDRAVDATFITEQPFSFVSSDLQLVSSEKPPMRITTGVPRLDDHMDGGLQAGEIGLITACPGVGKSNILTHFCVAANYSGIKSLLFTLELTGAMTKRRYTAMSAGILADRMKEPVETWKEEDLYRLYTVTRPEYITYDACAISEHTSSKITLPKIDAIIEQWRAYCRKRYGTDTDALLVCIDWQRYIIPPTKPSGGERLKHWEESREILVELGFIARRQNVAIWTANQGTADADGKSMLRMNDTASGYHINDPTTVSIGVGLGAQSKITEENMNSGVQPGDRHLVFSINKNRNGNLSACDIYRAPTLRLFDTEQAYASHRAATKSNTYRMMNLFNIKNPATLLRNAREIMPEPEPKELANAG